MPGGRQRRDHARAAVAGVPAVAARAHRARAAAGAARAMAGRDGVGGAAAGVRRLVHRALRQDQRARRHSARRAAGHDLQRGVRARHRRADPGRAAAEAGHPVRGGVRVRVFAGAGGRLRREPRCLSVPRGRRGGRVRRVRHHEPVPVDGGRRCARHHGHARSRRRRGRARRTAPARAPHAPAPRPARCLAARARGLRDYAAASEGPTILAGDFNASQDHAAFRHILDTGLRDGARLTGDARTPSWPARTTPTLGAQIDHVLVSEDFSANRATFLRITGTDHRALVVDVTLHRHE